MGTYSIVDAARILKVSPSRLRYWDRTELVQVREALGGGFDFRDLVCVRSILALLDQGVSLQRIRASVDALRDQSPDLDDPVRALRLWSKGSTRVVVDHGGVLIEPDGQVVLDFRDESPSADDVPSLDRTNEATGVAAGAGSALEWFEEGCRLDSDPSTYDGAAKAYLKGIEADPTFADLHCNLGAVYYNQGKKALARRSFERCLESSPGHVEAHFNLGNLLEEEGCNDLAMQHYRAAITSDPFCVDLHVNMALLYEKLGHPRRSDNHWRRYLQLEPDGTWSDVARLRLERDG